MTNDSNHSNSSNSERFSDKRRRVAASDFLKQIVQRRPLRLVEPRFQPRRAHLKLRASPLRREHAEHADDLIQRHHRGALFILPKLGARLQQLGADPRRHRRRDQPPGLPRHNPDVSGDAREELGRDSDDAGATPPGRGVDRELHGGFEDARFGALGLDSIRHGTRGARARFSQRHEVAFVVLKPADPLVTQRRVHRPRLKHPLVLDGLRAVPRARRVPPLGLSLVIRNGLRPRFLLLGCLFAHLLRTKGGCLKATSALSYSFGR